MDGREVDGYYIAKAYDGTDFEEEEIFYASAGVPDYVEEHEDAIDEALEQNPDKMIFPATLKEAGEALDPAYERGGSSSE
ncbi:hypothetical protein [Haloplanus natans]|uniref:hypothetical protein n=1 Tax=Haloplanus natans TaxID=376171 RepID=UPI0006779DF6|nr:hypothetical protein [Haloplanus natans]